jgi:hypothetical protein
MPRNADVMVLCDALEVAHVGHATLMRERAAVASPEAPRRRGDRVRCANLPPSMPALVAPSPLACYGAFSPHQKGMCLMRQQYKGSISKIDQFHGKGWDRLELDPPERKELVRMLCELDPADRAAIVVFRDRSIMVRTA